MTNETFCFVSDVREKKNIARGVYGMTKGYRSARPRLSLEGESSDVIIKKGDSIIVVPSSEIMKNGKIKKTYLRKIGLL